VHVIVRGRVQGVGFRYFTRECARRYGLTGWVRNLADGGVEVLAEGRESALESLVEEIRTGPRHGLVEDCRVSWQPASGRFERFEIAY
jgi:acylphosphatase